MINKKAKVLIALMLTSVPVFVFAQEVDINTVVAKVELLEDTNVKILNTIYWTIGTLGALFAAIIGLNIYSGYKINKEKISDIKKDLEDKIDTRLVDVEKLKKDLGDKIDTRLVDVEKLKIQTESDIKKHATEAENKLTELLKTKLTEVKVDINQKSKSVAGRFEERIRDLERAAILIEAKEYADKGIVSVAIDRMIEVLNIDIKKDWDFQIHDTLEKIKKMVEDNTLYSDTASELQKTLNLLSDEYSITREEIKRLIKIR